MASFRITGGQPLHGSITPQGAKNEALQVICATLLTEDIVTLHNVPDIRDVNLLIELLSDMNVSIEKTGQESYRFQAKHVDKDYLKTQEFAQKAASLRGSIMILVHYWHDLAKRQFRNLVETRLAEEGSIPTF